MFYKTRITDLHNKQVVINVKNKKIILKNYFLIDSKECPRFVIIWVMASTV